MANPEALEKLRAVLDYIPEEAARRLDGDPQEYYDALTRRLSRTVAVKSLVKRRVIVAQPEYGDQPEPSAPSWEPPPPLPDASGEPAPGAYLAPAAVEAASVVEASPAAGEAESVVEAAEPEAEPGEDFFDVTGRSKRMEAVEPDVSLSESEWSRLESAPEETAEAPGVAGQEAAADEAFEELELPEEPVPQLPEEARVGHHLGRAPGEAATETGVAEGELRPTAEFEVEEVGETTAAEEFEVLEEEEGEFEEGQEPAYQVNEFTLFRREARAKGGRVKTTYFFSAEPSIADAWPSALPEGYEVVLNESTGIPFIRKSTARIIPVIEIEGLGPVMAERLERAGVRTTKDLLRIDLRQVSEDTGISERLLGNFRAMSDLLQMPGIYPDQAAALVYAGCRSIADLKAANPTDLAKGVNQAAKDHQLKLRGKMTGSRVRGWQTKIAKLEPK